MGPSGAGKTTLLNVLAGQVSESSRLRLTGHLYINGKALSSSSPSVAYKYACMLHILTTQHHLYFQVKIKTDVENNWWGLLGLRM